MNAHEATCELPVELKQKYAIGRKLGAGACGEVRLLFIKDGSEMFAIKIIKKNSFGSGSQNILNNSANIRNEVEILKKLRHVSSSVFAVSFLYHSQFKMEFWISVAALYN